MSTLILSFVYELLSLFGIVPSFTKNEAGELLLLITNLLFSLGILVDPTTKGISDSERALGYYAVITENADEYNKTGKEEEA